jgi:glycerol-3-phosphate dehydrogenase
MDDLGHCYGADLTQAEVDYLCRVEFAQTAEDIVWRRSKLGLRMTQAHITALQEALDKRM